MMIAPASRPSRSGLRPALRAPLSRLPLTGAPSAAFLAATSGMGNAWSCVKSPSGPNDHSHTLYAPGACPKLSRVVSGPGDPASIGLSADRVEPGVRLLGLARAVPSPLFPGLARKMSEVVRKLSADVPDVDPLNVGGDHEPPAGGVSPQPPQDACRAAAGAGRRCSRQG